MMSPLLLALLPGCVRVIVGDGVTVVEEREVGTFDGIEAAGSIPVYVVGDGGAGVSVTCDNNLQPYIRVYVEGTTLHIEERGEDGEWVELRPEGDCRINVATPELKTVEISGSARLRVEDGVEVPLGALERGGISGSGTLDVLARQAGDSQRYEVSGSGAVLLDSVAASTLVLDISGSGTISAAGTADSSRVELSGSGNVQTRDVTASDVEVDLPGSGRVEVTATNRFTASLSGSGSIDVWGDPAERAEEVSGSGSIEYH